MHFKLDMEAYILYTYCHVYRDCSKSQFSALHSAQGGMERRQKNSQTYHCEFDELAKRKG